MRTRRRRTALVQCLAWITLMLAALSLAEPTSAQRDGRHPQGSTRVQR
jgi:hypothetical protein